MRNCSTLNDASCSCSASTSISSPGSSAIRRRPRRLSRAHLLRVDLLQAGALAEPGDLALRGVPLGNVQERRGADLVRDRRDPVEELLDPGAGVHLLTAGEVDQLTREAVANRPPHVLLEEAVGQVR